MEWIKEMEIKLRICSDSVTCEKCPLNWTNNTKYRSCVTFITEYPEKAKKILEKWDKEHPAESWKDKLLKTLPQCNTVEIVKRNCPGEFFKKAPTMKNCSASSLKHCVKCWDGEVEK